MRGEEAVRRGEGGESCQGESVEGRMSRGERRGESVEGRGERGEGRSNEDTLHAAGSSNNISRCIQPCGSR